MADAPRVAVLMGSDSDLPIMEGAVQMLERFGVPFVVRVMSAHRSPDVVAAFAGGAREAGLEAIIAGAGGAAHLAGVVAAHTTLPVIGVPIPTDRMGGMDSLLSTVQMPSGVPVATMGLGKSGARNAAVFAVQILAARDESLRAALDDYKAAEADAVRDKDARAQQWLEERS
jgi:phosphoribosylaminoimidazole carboxylase PurE protein